MDVLTGARPLGTFVPGEQDQRAWPRVAPVAMIVWCGKHRLARADFVTDRVAATGVAEPSTKSARSAADSRGGCHRRSWSP